MKTERFQRVVEWEEEPNIPDMFLAFLFFLIPIILIIFENTFIAGFVSGIFLISSIFIYIESLGKGKKVYWEKVKNG